MHVSPTFLLFFFLSLSLSLSVFFCLILANEQHRIYSTYSINSFILSFPLVLSFTHSLSLLSLSLSLSLLSLSSLSLSPLSLSLSLSSLSLSLSLPLSLFSKKDIGDDTVIRILHNFLPSLRQNLRMKDLLPYLKNHGILLESELIQLKVTVQSTKWGI